MGWEEGVRDGVCPALEGRGKWIGVSFVQCRLGKHQPELPPSPSPPSHPEDNTRAGGWGRGGREGGAGRDCRHIAGSKAELTPSTPTQQKISVVGGRGWGGREFAVTYGAVCEVRHKLVRSCVSVSALKMQNLFYCPSCIFSSPNLQPDAYVS